MVGYSRGRQQPDRQLAACMSLATQALRYPTQPASISRGIKMICHMRSRLPER